MLKKGKESENENRIDIKEIIVTNVTDEVLSTIHIDTFEDLCKIKAGQCFKKIFKFEPNVTIIYEDNSKKAFDNARDWMEHHAATTQCSKTIGNYKDSDTCYLCGLKFDEDTETPECEHVLPVFQACCFLDLYDKNFLEKLKSGMTRENMKELGYSNESYSKHMEMLRLEYKWAHRCCNQIKSDFSFLTFDKNTDKFVFDRSACSLILKGIAKGKAFKDDDSDGSTGKRRDYCDKIVEKLKKKKYGEWLDERLTYLQTSIIGPICTELNKTIGGVNNIENNKKLFLLSTIANIISSADKKYIDAVTRTVAGMEQIKYIIPISIIKSNIFINASQTIAQIFTIYSWNTKENLDITNLDIDPECSRKRKIKEFGYIINELFSPQSKKCDDYDIALYCSAPIYRVVEYNKLVNHILSHLTSSIFSIHNNIHREFRFQFFCNDLLNFADLIGITDNDEIKRISEIGTTILIYITLIENIDLLKKPTRSETTNFNNLEPIKEILQTFVVDQFTSLENQEFINYVIAFLYNINPDYSTLLTKIFADKGFVLDVDGIERIRSSIDTNFIKTIFNDSASAAETKSNISLDIRDLIVISVDTLSNMVNTDIKNFEEDQQHAIAEESKQSLKLLEIDQYLQNQLDSPIVQPDPPTDHSTSLLGIESLLRASQTIEDDIERQKEVLYDQEDEDIALETLRQIKQESLKETQERILSIMKIRKLHEERVVPREKKDEKKAKQKSSAMLGSIARSESEGGRKTQNKKLRKTQCKKMRKTKRKNKNFSK